MNPTMLKVFNQQINEEMFSAYLYLSAAAYCHERNLEGFAHWMESQAKEEMVHAMKFYNHLVERNEPVKLLAIEQPTVIFKGPTHVLQEALKHEKYISQKIHLLYEMATKEKDYRSLSMLEWFVDEQVEEENQVINLLAKIELTGEKGGTFYMLDREMGKRG